MIKYLFISYFFIVASCNNVSDKNDKQLNTQNIILTEKVEKEISKYCNEYDSLKPIYTLTIIQMYNNVFIHPYPVLYRDVLAEMKNPITYFEYQNKLFIVYSGLEKFTSSNSYWLQAFKQKYDSVCNKYHIDGINISYDSPPLFLKLEGDSLTQFEDAALRDVFFGRKF